MCSAQVWYHINLGSQHLGGKDRRFMSSRIAQMTQQDPVAGRRQGEVTVQDPSRP